MSDVAGQHVKLPFEELESIGGAFRRLPRTLLTATHNFLADGLFNQCAAISYYALLSVAPFLGLLAAILGFLLGSSERGMNAALNRINALGPELPDLIKDVAAGFIANRGTIGAAALIVTLWVSHLVFASIQTAVAQIFRRPPDEMDWRHFALRALWAWIRPFLLFFAAATLLVMSFAVQSIISVVRDIDTPLALRFLEFAESSTVISIATSLVATIVVFAVVLQTLTPQWLPLPVLLPSAVVGAALSEIAGFLFSSYLRYAASVRNFTGSAGAAVVFMVWIYYAAMALLFSLQVAAILSGARAPGTGVPADPGHTL